MEMFEKLKRICSIMIMVVLVCALSGCSEGYSVSDGRYCPEDGNPLMFFTIEDCEYAVFRHIAYDFVPSGKVERQGNELILGDFHFEIIEDNKVKYVTEDPEGVWDDGIVFVLDNSQENSSDNEE